MASSNQPPPTGFKVRGLRTQTHGEHIEQLSVTLENMKDVFSKMRSAVMAEVKDTNGDSRTVVCREVGSEKMILLLEPLNDRATAETMSLRSFATRYKQVTVSYDSPKSL